MNYLEEIGSDLGLGPLSLYCHLPGKWGLKQKPSPMPKDVRPHKNVRQDKTWKTGAFKINCKMYTRGGPGTPLNIGALWPGLCLIWHQGNFQSFSLDTLQVNIVLS